jgi:hypothetical protein
MKKDLIEVVGPMGRKVLPREQWQLKYRKRDNWYTVEEYQKMKEREAKKNKKKKPKPKKEKSK